MSKDKYAHKKPTFTSQEEVDREAQRYAKEPLIILDDPLNAAAREASMPDPNEIETTATLSFARSRGGSIAVMLEVDGVVTRGRADLRSKREGLADLMRCVDDLGKLVAAPVGRGKR